MSKSKLLISALILLALVGLSAGDSPTYQPEFSVGGFFEVDQSPRKVFDFNQGWRFIKSDARGAHKVDYNDSQWERVSLPHGLELVPLNASGCVNYQGPAWYRKQFTVAAEFTNSQIFIHFEAIMGKSEIWINGKKVSDHLGGYLPIHIDVTQYLKNGESNLIAVFADNSDDKDYPPGKSQKSLDFSYFGGIYRDSYLIALNDIYISNANAADKTAGGGLFIHYDEWSEQGVSASVAVDLFNKSTMDRDLTVDLQMVSPDGSSLPVVSSSVKVMAQTQGSVTSSIRLNSPKLWTPDNPALHQLIVSIKENGKVLDSVRLKTGVRKIEFKGREGFFLNGKAYQDKLIGGNRHQDYAYIGNALPNSGQWRDAAKMREAGMKIVRSAHYPMDPAFMDACDELGLFVIVATPGWQFWNVKKTFEQLVLKDIRNMVRRDRNHASVLMWEPILNETHYPKDFAKKTYDAVHSEYPFQGCYAACDEGARGEKVFDIVYAHPRNSDRYAEKLMADKKTLKSLEKNYRKDDRPVFNREWGDNVDDWSSHNSPSRVYIGWGEQPQLVQMQHYSLPPYPFSTYHTQYLTPAQHFGGTLWHTFDHQRGYHPDPFWGGILDAFRQPKYSFFMFKSQVNPELSIAHIETGPYIKILHEISPFSGGDVWVVSNCDEVRLTVFGKNCGTLKTVDSEIQMPHKPVLFKNVYRFMDLKALHRSGQQSSAFFKAEGLIDGKSVVSEKKYPAIRLDHIEVRVDYTGAAFRGDGSDIIPVVATLCDKRGSVRRWSDEYIRFSISGPAKIVDDGKICANPVKAEWGQAVILIRSTGGEGTVTVFAEVLRAGEHEAVSGMVTLSPVNASMKSLYDTQYASGSGSLSEVLADDIEVQMKALEIENGVLRKQLNALDLQEVEKQQEEFEVSGP